MVVPCPGRLLPVLRLLRPQAQEPAGRSLAQIQALGPQFLVGRTLSRLSLSVRRLVVSCRRGFRLALPALFASPTQPPGPGLPPLAPLVSQDLGRSRIRLDSGRGYLLAGLPAGRGGAGAFRAAGATVLLEEAKCRGPGRGGSGDGGRVLLRQAAIPALRGDALRAAGRAVHVEGRFRSGLLARAAGDGYQPGQRGRLPRQRRVGGLGQFAVRSILAAADRVAGPDVDQPPGLGFDGAESRGVPISDRGQSAG